MKTVIFDMHGVIYQFSETASNEMHIVAFSRALECIDDFLKNDYQVVVLSTSSVDHSAKVLDILIKEEHSLSKNLLNQIIIETMQDYGSKASIESWEKVFNKYQEVMYLFEDGENNRAQALKASKIFQSQLITFSSIEAYYESFKV